MPKHHLFTLSQERFKFIDYYNNRDSIVTHNNVTIVGLLKTGIQIAQQLVNINLSEVTVLFCQTQ